MPEEPAATVEIPWILIIVGVLLGGALLAPMYQTQVCQVCDVCEAERVQTYPACLLFRYPFTRHVEENGTFVSRMYQATHGECRHRYVETGRASGMAWSDVEPARDAARQQWIAAYQLAKQAMPAGDFERLTAMVFDDDAARRRIARDALRELTTGDLSFRMAHGMPLTDRR